jgi:hypothetical protein
VPVERILLERLIPRRSTLRSDRRPGNRAASPGRSPFLIECQGTERSLNAPRRAAHNAGVEVSGSAVSVPRVESPTKGQPIAAPISVAPHLQGAIGMYMNCQVRGRLVLRRNCFGVSDRRVQDARRSRHRGCARPCTGLDARSVGCPILSNHHFDLPWAGTEGGVIAEKLVKVLPS